MLKSPFRYEEWLTSAEFEKVGELSLRWSHIDHIIGTCLMVMLRLSDEQAIIMVFPLSLDQRLNRLKKLSKLKRINKDAKAALDGLTQVATYIQQVRNIVIHAILADDPNEGLVFHLRSKTRSLTKQQVFEIEELTNYAAHAALALRFALEIKGARGERHPLPDMPAIPKFLHNPSPT